jgi:hypothetical protein
MPIAIQIARPERSVLVFSVVEREHHCERSANFDTP